MSLMVHFFLMLNKSPLSRLTTVCCCCCSVTKSCPTLCNSTDCGMLAFPVPHHLLEFAQVHVHCISDAIQPSHPLLPSSPSAFHLSTVYSPTRWHHRCFQVLANTNKTARSSVKAMFTSIKHMGFYEYCALCTWLHFPFCFVHLASQS